MSVYQAVPRNPFLAVRVVLPATSVKSGHEGAMAELHARLEAIRPYSLLTLLCCIVCIVPGGLLGRGGCLGQPRALLA